MKLMQGFGFSIDFDDSTTYQAMKNLGVDQVISFDRDFDRISGIKRIERLDYFLG